MRQVGVMAFVGDIVGIVIAFAVGRVAKSLLFEMEASDPLVFGGAAVALVLVALGAGLLPAMRASKIDPMDALRYE